MIFVSQTDRLERRSICRGCEHYTKTTDSCGTLIVAGLTGEELGTHVHTGEQKPLCGCWIKQKSKFVFASCPLGKWDRLLLTDDQLRELEAIVALLEGKKDAGHLSGHDIRNVNKAMKIVTGFDSFCGTCAADAMSRLSELRRDLKAK